MTFRHTSQNEYYKWGHTENWILLYKYSVKRKEVLATQQCFVILTLDAWLFSMQHWSRCTLKQTRNVLIRYLNVELLFGLAESSAVEFSGHFNKVITAEQEISFTGSFWALKQEGKQLGLPKPWVSLHGNQEGGFTRSFLMPVQGNKNLLSCKLNRDCSAVYRLKIPFAHK